MFSDVTCVKVCIATKIFITVLEIHVRINIGLLNLYLSVRKTVHSESNSPTRSPCGSPLAQREKSPLDFREKSPLIFREKSPLNFRDTTAGM